MDKPLESKPIKAADEPMVVHCEPGNYSWCSCGHSQAQPWCDTAHREKSELRSVKFEIEKAGEYEFCMCKQTGTPPFCDGTHATLKD